MKGWTVQLRPVARREYRRLDSGPKQAASELIEDLMEDPAQVPALEMRGMPGTWRARFHHDGYRMIYQISKAEKRVIVTAIRPRSTAYDGLKS